MRRPKGPWPLVAVGSVGLVALLVLSEPGARLIATLGAPRSKPSPVLGLVTNHTGPVIRVRGGRTERRERTTDQPFEFLDGDRLETTGATEADLNLSSQDELVVGPKSVVALELWNPLDTNSPIYVHVLSGDVKAKHTGVRGRAYVVRDGRLYLPGQAAGDKRAPLIITRAAGSAVTAGSGDPSPEAPPTDFTTPSELAEAPVRNDDPETLANEYVDGMIASRQDQIQTCWLSRLKDKPDLKGVLTVQFEINRRGKVRDVKVTGSTLEDEQLANCVKSVVERLPFRSFTGPDVSFAYPITFQ